MFIAYVIVTVLTIAANAAVSIADVAGAKFVRANAAKVGLKPSWIPVVATLKMAGAIGLLIGLLWLKPLGIAAAIGLVLFFIGALAAHVRAHVYYNIAFPGIYFMLAVASLVLALTQ